MGGLLEILGKILENTAKGESDKQPMAGLHIQNLLCAVSIAVTHLSVLQFQVRYWQIYTRVLGLCFDARRNTERNAGLAAGRNARRVARRIARRDAGLSAGRNDGRDAYVGGIAAVVLRRCGATPGTIFPTKAMYRIDHVVAHPASQPHADKGRPRSQGQGPS